MDADLNAIADRLIAAYDSASMLEPVTATLPNFSVSDYSTKHPYRDPEKLSKITTTLREAGLPD